MFIRTVLAFLVTTTFSLVAADARDATETEANWFAGTWNATRGIAAEGETLIAGDPKVVVIRHVGAARIERDFPLRNGAVATTAYTVRSFGVNFPWWTDDANGVGNQVSKRIDENTFHLAQVGERGMADWANGWTYVRVVVPTQK
jgi:hypothetical protein